MTKQETFDYVVTALKKQGVPSYDRKTAFCVYRGPNGTKCAAGWLIPDDKYDSKFEFNAITASAKLQKLMVNLGHDVQLTIALQNAHDNPTITCGDDKVWLPEFLRRARGVAGKFGLNPAVCGISPQ